MARDGVQFAPPFAEHPPPVTDDLKITSFRELGLPDALLEALTAVGYESPSPIQSETIPRLLNGEDVLGQAQTGTGKTAAFALPILARIDVSQNTPIRARIGSANAAVLP